MSLESSVLALYDALECLCRALEQVRSACDDHPEPGDVVFVDLYGDAADDLTGRIQEALRSMEGARRAGEAGDVTGSARPLSQASRALQEVREQLYFDLVHPRLGELALMGRERGGEWAAWSGAVRDAVERCLVCLAQAERERDAAWSELGERAAGGQVLIRAVGPNPQHTR